jgi:phosphatidylserine decarboxylase
VSIAPQGFKFVGVLFACSLILAFFEPTRLLSLLPLLLAAFVAFFFRDPERRPPEDPKLLVSPADGKVVYVGSGQQSESEKLKISIFLSLFDVHINRSPLSATISNLRYRPGRFLAAYRPEASSQNEQNEVELADGEWKIVVRQIAGVVARRIVFYKKLGEHLERGERFGLIQFGSRTDIILPPDVKVRVKVGDRVKGGASVVAERP